MQIRKLKQEIMKTVAILGIAFLGMNAFGQNMVVETNDQNNVLYRGYENRVTIGQAGTNAKDFKLEAINCQLAEVTGQKDMYIVKPSSAARTAQINFVSNGKIVDSTVFVVESLPSPLFYWGNNENGSDVSSASTLEIKYPSDVALDASFTITNWECKIGEMSFKGSGSVLSQKILDVTKALPVGGTVNIIVTVNTPDGIARKVVGSWVKK